jgi:hypothetical protein
MAAAAQVVNQHFGATRAEQQGVGAAEAIARAGDEDNFAVKSELISHVPSDVLLFRPRPATHRLRAMISFMISVEPP